MSLDLHIFLYRPAPVSLFSPESAIKFPCWKLYVIHHRVPDQKKDLSRPLENHLLTSSWLLRMCRAKHSNWPVALREQNHTAFSQLEPATNSAPHLTPHRIKPIPVYLVEFLQLFFPSLAAYGVQKKKKKHALLSNDL